MRLLFELSLLFLSFMLITSNKLIFIQCVTRHGVRYPSFPNPYDHSNISLLQNSKSQLTNQGRHMQFILGRAIYKKYWNQLFGKQSQNKFNNSMILAKSTNTNRTIQSLQNLLLGLFYSVQHQKILFKQGSQFYPPFTSLSDEFVQEEADIYWSKQRTVPIHVEKGAEGDPGIANSYNQGDFLVKQEYNLCPNQKFWQEQNYKSDIVNKIMNSSGMLKSIEVLKPFFPGFKFDFQNLYKIVDNYYCLKAMGRPNLPIFQNKQIKSYLQFARIAKLYITYLYTQKQIKTFSHSLIATTIYNMKRAIDGKGPKMVFYSGHDVTIGTLLTALNLTNTKCLFQSYIQHKNVANCYIDYPHFASSFIFQLWQEDNNYFIEISINGQKHRLPICNYSQTCNLQQFQSWFKNNTIQNTPNEECGVPSVKSQKIYIEMALVFCLGVAIPFLLYCCFENKKKKEEISLQNSSMALEDDIE